MFERFTVSARTVVTSAVAESEGMGHGYVGTEHLLLGLLAAADSRSARILGDAGVTADQVRADLARLVAGPAGTLTEDDAEALRTVGIDLDEVLARIEDSVGALRNPPPEPEPKRGLLGRLLGNHSPFTPRAKKVLELALREAIRLKSKEIRDEHILLGLLREGEGLAAKIFADASVDVAALRQAAERES